MKLSIIGTGNIGLVAALSFAKAGHHVVALDQESNKVNQLNEGFSPIYEPGLQELLQQQLFKKSILFTTDFKLACEEGEVFFVTVGTPLNVDRSADLNEVRAVLEKLKQEKSAYGKLVVIKSTVPPGTTLKLSKDYPEFRFAFNPEFVSAGTALFNFQNPDRIVIGSSNPEDIGLLKKIYKLFYKNESNFLTMAFSSAELSKYAANSFLAARIALINEFARFAEVSQANIDHVAEAIGMDHRIGPHFLKAGLGYGGSCFPKDLAALSTVGKNHNVSSPVIDAVQKSNNDQLIFFADKVLKYFASNADLSKKLTIWGVSFKPDTNDLRESPSLKLIKTLLEKGFQIQVHDPRSMLQFEKEKILSNSNAISFQEDPEVALKGSNALLILTDWPLYLKIGLKSIKEGLQNPALFDARNIFNLEEVKNFNFDYHSIGRHP